MSREQEFKWWQESVELAQRLEAENRELKARLTRNPELDDGPGVLVGDAKAVAMFLNTPKHATKGQGGAGATKKPRRSKRDVSEAQRGGRVGNSQS